MARLHRCVRVSTCNYTHNAAVATSFHSADFASGSTNNQNMHVRAVCFHLRLYIYCYIRSSNTEPDQFTQYISYVQTLTAYGHLSTICKDTQQDVDKVIAVRRIL